MPRPHFPYAPFSNQPYTPAFLTPWSTTPPKTDTGRLVGTGKSSNKQGPVHCPFLLLSVDSLLAQAPKAPMPRALRLHVRSCSWHRRPMCMCTCATFKVCRNNHLLHSPQLIAVLLHNSHQLRRSRLPPRVPQLRRLCQRPLLGGTLRPVCATHAMFANFTLTHTVNAVLVSWGSPGAQGMRTSAAVRALRYRTTTVPRKPGNCVDLTRQCSTLRDLLYWPRQVRINSAALNAHYYSSCAGSQI